MRRGRQLFSDVYIVSPAQTVDVAEIKRIEIECMLSPWTTESYFREFEREDSVVLKAQDHDGSISGFLLGRAPRQNEAAIYNIGTAAAFRRKGIGSLLLDEFRNQAIARSSSVIWLEVRASNEPAINFYLSKGFVRRGVRKSFYSDPVDDALIMSLPLQGS